jgi:N-acetylneuraminate synthase
VTVFIIAEAGVNHNGDEALALRLVEAAAEAGADAVKFQTFMADSLVTRGTDSAEYQQKTTGVQDQHELLKTLEIDRGMHKRLFDHCESVGIEFLSSPFDIESAKFLVQLGVAKIKIPSGELTNLPFLTELANLETPIILSTGMSTLGEVQEAVNTIHQAWKNCGYTAVNNENLTVLHCTSNYPTAYKDVNLLAMKTMSQNLNPPIGYSDHTSGITVAPLAVAMGATIIEKHITLDKEMPGPDHKASLNPTEFTKMVEQIRLAEVCIGDGEKTPCESELLVQNLVRRSVTLIQNKNIGDTLNREDLALLRPGTGIPPKEFDKVVGKQLKTRMPSGTTLTWNDLSDA